MPVYKISRPPYLKGEHRLGEVYEEASGVSTGKGEIVQAPYDPVIMQ